MTESASEAYSATVFRPPTSFGALSGAVVVVLCYAVAVGLLLKGLATTTSTEQALPLIGAGFFFLLASLFAYWTWSRATLSYTVDRNALEIRWGGLRQVVPLGEIGSLVPAGATEQAQIEGVSWPGHHVGRADVDQLGSVLFYSGHRSMDEVLYVETPAQIYAISVPDPIVFAQAVQANQERGPLFEVPQEAHRSGIAAQSFWLDGNARLLAAALIASFIAVLVYVLTRYPDLPQSVPLRFPSLGGIVRVSDKSDLLDLPRSGLGFLALNLSLAVLLHNWERMVAYVLLLAGVSIQIMLLVAAIVAVA